MTYWQIDMKGLAEREKYLAASSGHDDCMDIDGASPIYIQAETKQEAISKFVKLLIATEADSTSLELIKSHPRGYEIVRDAT